MNFQELYRASNARQNSFLVALFVVGVIYLIFLLQVISNFKFIPIFGSVFESAGSVSNYFINLVPIFAALGSLAAVVYLVLNRVENKSVYTDLPLLS